MTQPRPWPQAPPHEQLAGGWGTPPPQRPRNRTTVWVLSAIAAVLALALVAVVLVVALRADDTGGGTGGGTASSGDLLDSLPADLLDCSSSDLVRDGAGARGTVACGRSAQGVPEA